MTAINPPPITLVHSDVNEWRIYYTTFPNPHRDLFKEYGMTWVKGNADQRHWIYKGAKIPRCIYEVCQSQPSNVKPEDIDDTNAKPVKANSGTTIAEWATPEGTFQSQVMSDGSTQTVQVSSNKPIAKQPAKEQTTVAQTDPQVLKLIATMTKRYDREVLTAEDLIGKMERLTEAPPTNKRSNQLESYQKDLKFHLLLIGAYAYVLDTIRLLGTQEQQFRKYEAIDHRIYKLLLQVGLVKDFIHDLLGYNGTDKNLWYKSLKETAAYNKPLLNHAPSIDQLEAIVKRIAEQAAEQMSKSDLMLRAIALETLINERDLLMSKIPGYFPTPMSLADFAIQIAREVFPDDKAIKILEPSAGSGRLLLAARHYYRKSQVWAIEVNYKLAEHLTKLVATVLNHTIVVQHKDFMEVAQTPYYDLVVMNPPFENNQDIKHVRHAYDGLLNGGRLIAIMSPHFSFANDKESVNFRSWLEQQKHKVLDVPAGTFKASGTNIATKIVVIDKPTSTTQPFNTTSRFNPGTRPAFAQPDLPAPTREPILPVNQIDSNPLVDQVVKDLLVDNPDLSSYDGKELALAKQGTPIYDGLYKQLQSQNKEMTRTALHQATEAAIVAIQEVKKAQAAKKDKDNARKEMLFPQGEHFTSMRSFSNPSRAITTPEKRMMIDALAYMKTENGGKDADAQFARSFLDGTGQQNERRMNALERIVNANDPSVSGASIRLTAIALRTAAAQFLAGLEALVNEGVAAMGNKAVTPAKSAAPPPAPPTKSQILQREYMAAIKTGNAEKILSAAKALRDHKE